jgi:hypothetical protein
MRPFVRGQRDYYYTIEHPPLDEVDHRGERKEGLEVAC